MNPYKEAQLIAAHAMNMWAGSDKEDFLYEDEYDEVFTTKDEYEKWLDENWTTIENVQVAAIDVLAKYYKRTKFVIQGERNES